MNFDWYSEYSKKSIDEIRKLSINCFSKIKLLNIYGNLNLDKAKRFHKELVYGLRSPKIDPEYHPLILESLIQMDTIGLKIPKITDLNTYPLFSFFIQIPFTLATPYISKDDEEFYICENPVRKDKVFKVPMVSGSFWKGNLRWTVGKILEFEGDKNRQFSTRVQIAKLFGHENESEERYFDSLMSDKKDDFRKEMRNWASKEDLRSGRLNFYPTFFDRINLEVINPHDRKTKAGTNPIYIENVPENSNGTFSLLYVPFDLMGKQKDIIKNEVENDLKLVCQAIGEMLLTYGFSAKKSSGFGVAKPDSPLKDEWLKGNGVEIADKGEFTKLSDLKKEIKLDMSFEGTQGKN